MVSDMPASSLHWVTISPYSTQTTTRGIKTSAMTQARVVTPVWRSGVGERGAAGTACVRRERWHIGRQSPAAPAANIWPALYS